MRKKLSLKSYYKSLSIKDKEKLAEVEKLCNKMIEENGVGHYKFKYGRSRTYAGKCTSSVIKLEVSYVLRKSLEEIRNTILHEIAHAMVGVDAGHKKEWQDKARELGVTWNINYRK